MVTTSLLSNASIIEERIKIFECVVGYVDSILDLHALYCTPFAIVLPLIIPSHFSFISDNTHKARFFYLKVSLLALIE